MAFCPVLPGAMGEEWEDCCFRMAHRISSSFLKAKEFQLMGIGECAGYNGCFVC